MPLRISGPALGSGVTPPPAEPPATKPVETSIVISGERVTVSGKEIVVNGVTTGLAEGDTVKVFIRFPGQTAFTEGTVRTEIANGGFVWQRRISKRAVLYFTTMDGSVQSNRIVIPAAVVP
jgi:hypothetical protein